MRPLVNVPGSFKQPHGNPGTLVRVVGPLIVNGMNVWRVFALREDGRPLRQVGPDMMIEHEAHEYAADLARGRKTFFYGGSRFVRKGL